MLFITSRFLPVNRHKNLNTDKLKIVKSEVHDKFNEAALNELIAELNNSNKTHYLIAHPESPLPVLKKSHHIGSTFSLLQWVKNHNATDRDVILVATEDGILYNMRTLRPDLDIRQAPIYTGCKCNSCPYMKLNQVDSIKSAKLGNSGVEIDYINEDLLERAKLPIIRMLEFSKTHSL